MEYVMFVVGLVVGVGVFYAGLVIGGGIERGEVVRLPSVRRLPRPYRRETRKG